MTQKYKITIKDLETKGSIAKFERDGVSRETIFREMYKQTDGATKQEREQIVRKIYERGEPC